MERQKKRERELGEEGLGDKREDSDHHHFHHHHNRPHDHTPEIDEYGKGESVEDIIPYLLPMKCCIRTKFGDIALNEDEWEAGDNFAKQPRLFPGLMFLRYV